MSFSVNGLFVSFIASFIIYTASVGFIFVCPFTDAITYLLIISPNVFSNISSANLSLPCSSVICATLDIVSSSSSSTDNQSSLFVCSISSSINSSFLCFISCITADSFAAFMTFVNVTMLTLARMITTAITMESSTSVNPFFFAQSDMPVLLLSVFLILFIYFRQNTSLFYNFSLLFVNSFDTTR